MKRYELSGKYLRQCRNDLNLSQAFVAEKSGVFPQVVYAWESGTVFIPSNKIKKITRLLNVCPKKLVAIYASDASRFNGDKIRKAIS